MPRRCGAGGNAWLMYFDGFVDDLDADRDRAIGVATSADGVTWEAPTEPVFRPDPDPEAWDHFRVRSPSVIRMDDGWVMTYMASWRLSTPGFRSDFGYATSPDGVTWTRGEQGQIVDDARLGFITDGTASMIGDEFVLFFDGAASITSPSSTIFHATASPSNL